MRPQSSTIPHHHLAPNKGVQPLSLLALHIQIYYLRQLVSWGEKCGGVDTYKPKLQSHPLLQQKSCPGSKPLIFFSPDCRQRHLSIRSLIAALEFEWLTASGWHIFLFLVRSKVLLFPTTDNLPVRRVSWLSVSQVMRMQASTPAQSLPGYCRRGDQSQPPGAKRLGYCRRHITAPSNFCHKLRGIRLDRQCSHLKTQIAKRKRWKQRTDVI